MHRNAFAFDAVIFDLDGTLVATERFWVAAAQAGARRAFDELGLDRAMPSAREWLSMVGHSIHLGFRNIFPELDERHRAHVMQRCIEAEDAALSAGGATLMPGALEALVQLREAGVSIGLASNCGRSYLEHMLRALPLGEHVNASRCLDSPGVQDKSGMLGQLLKEFGTRSAVMVGDRRTDAEAARANGLPHVHLASGLAPEGEAIDCDARIDVLADLVPCIQRRSQWIEGALENLGILRSGRPVRGGARTIGISGHSAAGKSLFARDFARIASARGKPTVVVALDAYARAAEPGELERTSDAAHESDPLAAAFDVERLSAELLAPHRAGEVARARDGTPVPSDALLVLEGLFLLHPRVRLYLDRVLFLDVAEATSLRRIATRDAPETLVTARRVWMPAQRAFDVLFDPAARADLVLDAENCLGPAPTGA